MELQDVAEIEECGRVRCNQLLALGYKMIGHASQSFEAPRQSVGAGVPATFIRHTWYYVIARTAEMPAFPVREMGDSSRAPVLTNAKAEQPARP